MIIRPLLDGLGLLKQLSKLTHLFIYLSFHLANRLHQIIAGISNLRPLFL